MIRRAETIEDGHALIALIRRLAEFESLPGPDDDAVERFLIDGFGRSPACFEAYLADDPELGPIGYVLFFQTYSTFLCRPSLYIEDLFVLPDLRGRGHGKALLTLCLDLARERGCGRVEWAVLDWNTEAQDFYKSIGARHLKEWHLYRLMTDPVCQ